MKTTIFEGSTQKFTLLLRAAGLKGRQVAEAIRETTEGLVEEIRAEIGKGNYKEVITFLAPNAIIWGKTVLLEKLTSRVASRLMLRLGLPGIIAAGVVAVLVPFVLMKLRKKAMEKKDAEEFLDTFEIVGDEELQGQVQKALDQGTARPAGKVGEETPAKEGAPDEPAS